MKFYPLLANESNGEGESLSLKIINSRSLSLHWKYITLTPSLKQTPDAIDFSFLSRIANHHRTQSRMDEDESDHTDFLIWNTKRRSSKSNVKNNDHDRTFKLYYLHVSTA